jgi:hypothetical protein
MKYCMTQLHRDIGEMHTNWLVSKTSMSAYAPRADIESSLHRDLMLDESPRAVPRFGACEVLRKGLLNNVTQDAPLRSGNCSGINQAMDQGSFRDPNRTWRIAGEPTNNKRAGWFSRKLNDV